MVASQPSVFKALSEEARALTLKRLEVPARVSTKHRMVRIVPTSAMSAVIPTSATLVDAIAVGAWSEVLLARFLRTVSADIQRDARRHAKTSDGGRDRQDGGVSPA